MVGLSKSYDLSHYKAAFSAYLGLLPLMGYGEEDAKEAYLKKLKVNHERQEGHY
ncbi:MAG: dUTP diphosphatase [Bacilli bacterium]|nr:dUTP diphosphatase [Bacilli bacterium]